MTSQIRLLEGAIATCGITGKKTGFFFFNGWLLLEGIKKMEEFVALGMSKFRTGLSRFSFVKGNNRKIATTEFTVLF